MEWRLNDILKYSKNAHRIVVVSMTYLLGSGSANSSLSDGYTHEYIWQMPFDKYMECHNSYLFNRQVVMLANLTEDTCPPLGGYSQVKADMQHPEKRLRRKRMWTNLLQSAVDNLTKLDFFGLTNEQKLSQELFEWMLKVKFRRNFFQINETITVNTKTNISRDSLKKLVQVMGPDIALYKYASQLFYTRVEAMQNAQ